MNIMAIDPGLGTGLAFYNTVTGNYNAEEIAGFHDASIKIAGYINAPASLYVVIERYTITARTAKLTQQTEALRLTGVAEYAAIMNNCTVKFQTPAQRKWSTDEKLKALGWYEKTKDGHRNDASRHLLVACVNNNWLTDSDKDKLRNSL